MPNEPKKGNKPLVVVVVLLLLCVVVAGWQVMKSRRARANNQPPIAALRLDFLDETNRVATLSDDGSRDDGTIRSWRIDWGDGKADNLSAMPQKAAHTYDAEGEFTISVWCVDNYSVTSSLPAMTNITFDFQKRQKALELAQAEAEAEAKRQAEAKRLAEAKLQADRLKAEQARKEAERLEQERQKALAAQKAKEQQDLEAKRKADAELERQKAIAATKTPTPPPATPLAAGLPADRSSREAIFTPPGYTLGELQITKEKTEGRAPDGNLLVVLAVRCVNFPDTTIPTSDWQIDGKNVQLQAGRIRASLSPGRHDVTALLARKLGAAPTTIMADVTVRTNGDCVVKPRK